MNRYLALGYGALNYLVFLVVFLYSIGFVGNLVVPRTVDHAITANLWPALVIDVLLLGLFAVQHSVMARPAFKRWLTRALPAPIERSTHVLASNIVLILLFWQWRAIPTIVWNVTTAPARIGLWVLFGLGWAIALASTFLINHFDLFGLRQVYLTWRAQPYTPLGFRTPLLYRVVRHPLMLGFFIAFWATPTMTAGHLLFAAATTGYILIAPQLEEQDLTATLGEPYRHYQRQVPILIPGLHRRARPAKSQTRST